MRYSSEQSTFVKETQLMDGVITLIDVLYLARKSKRECFCVQGRF